MSNCSNKSCNNELPRLAKADVNLEDDYCSDCNDLYNHLMELDIIELSLMKDEDA